VFSEIDDISIEWEDEGLVKIKEEGKEVLTRGVWSTIMFLYRDWDASRDAYSDLRVSIRRYRKMGGRYQQQSKFNISSAKQAAKITEILQKWYAQG
jgi:hypothetical protein